MRGDCGQFPRDVIEFVRTIAWDRDGKCCHGPDYRQDRVEVQIQNIYFLCCFFYACGYILSLDLSGGTSPAVPSEESVAFAKLTHVQIRNLLAMFYGIITLASLCAFLSGQLNTFL